jgi:hypothetical protein
LASISFVPQAARRVRPSVCSKSKQHKSFAKDRSYVFPPMLQRKDPTCSKLANSDPPCGIGHIAKNSSGRNTDMLVVGIEQEPPVTIDLQFVQKLSLICLPAFR